MWSQDNFVEDMHLINYEAIWVLNGVKSNHSTNYDLRKKEKLDNEYIHIYGYEIENAPEEGHVVRLTLVTLLKRVK